MKKKLTSTKVEKEELKDVINKLGATLDSMNHAKLIVELENDYRELTKVGSGSRVQLAMLQKKLIIDQLNYHFTLPQEFSDLIDVLNNYKQEDTSYKKYGLSGIITDMGH